MRAIQQPQISEWQPYVFFKDEFSKEECEVIIQLAKIQRPESAKTGGAESNESRPEIRSSTLHWMHENEQSKWVFDKLEAVCQKVKAGWYPFTLTAFMEPIQLTKYLASEGGHYDWHQDFGAKNMSTRKLSIVMLLSDPAEFKGGELEIMGIPGDDKKCPHIAQGTVIVFPSWAHHRVLKITEGTRWSLVSWVHGPPFA